MRNANRNTPYGKYLENNHFLTRTLPIDDTQTHRLVIKWLKPNETEPTVFLTRLINVALNGEVHTQDTIQIGRDNGFVELSAEFSQDGELLRSPGYDGDDYFDEIIKKMEEIQQIEGSRLSLSLNGSSPHYLYSHEGQWFQKPNGEGGRALPEGIRFLP